MQPVKRKEFFDSYRESFGPLAQQQVDGLEALLASLEADTKITALCYSHRATLSAQGFR